MSVAAVGSRVSRYLHVAASGPGPEIAVLLEPSRQEPGSKG